MERRKSSWIAAVFQSKRVQKSPAVVNTPSEMRMWKCGWNSKEDDQLC
jgi:hypothetical protein